MRKSNHIINSEILAYLNDLVNLTANEDIIWYCNNDEPDSYVTDKCQDSECNFSYKLTISSKETIIDDDYSYNLLITVIDSDGNETTNYINKHSVNDLNSDGLHEQVDEVLENLYNKASTNVYDKHNLQIADLLANVLHVFSK